MDFGPSPAASNTHVVPGLDPRYTQRDQSPRRLVSQPMNGNGGGGERGGQPAAHRRTPPRAGRDAERRASTKTKARLGSSAPAKPLLPVTERRSQEDNAFGLKTRKDVELDKWDITPDGGSASREGRQFTVANVGNNGRIYLRPSVRPAHQRYPQPQFVFPMTPPSTAGLDAGAEKDKKDRNTELENSQWTPSLTPDTPLAKRGYFPEGGSRSMPTHRRALSDSTIPDTSIARESDAGGFKIVISRPGEEKRPRTVEDMDDPANQTLLDVSIPSWKIGNPRFTQQGTPFFRGSSYAPTEEFRGSRTSLLNTSQRSAPLTPASISSRMPSPITIPRIHLSPLDAATPVSVASAPLNLQAPGLLPSAEGRSTYMSNYMVIEPSMFDALTFKPACDDRTLVRYSSATGAVTAATPPRLVAEITSPTFLDYELLSDFFLTFRAFMETSDLLRMLVARLKWALAREDETGMVVRVRTFVALRHWILNYFMDDFLVDYGIRVTFCNLLNDFVDELSHDPRGRKVQLKILAELKKCWRRVCAQYWDGPDFDSSLGPDIPIAAGGIAGHRNPSLDPSFWETDDDEDAPPQLSSFMVRNDRSSFYADLANAGHAGSTFNDRPATPDAEHREMVETHRRQMSPTSIASLDVLSCSFPTKNMMRMAQAGPMPPPAAHPAEPSSVYSGSAAVATTPGYLTGKRIRPQNSHKRSGSLSDSLRDHDSVTEKVIFKNAEFLLTLPYAGSLVRGNLFPPGQAFVDYVPPSATGAASRETTLFQPPTQEPQKERLLDASAMSSQGMKKLLGSVRRAISTRGQGISPTIGNFISVPPIGPRGATTNRLPGTAIVPQARAPRANGTRPPVRVDILGAEIAEDFKKAVREDAAMEADRIDKERHALDSICTSVSGTGDGDEGMVEYSAAHMDTSFDGDDKQQQELRPVSDMAITTGSKSIVIVDDTIPMSSPAMSGALPTVNASVEAFAEAFMRHGADPTPPTTPPARELRSREMPRRSSLLLNRHLVWSSQSGEPLPPFIPDMATLEPRRSTARPSQETTRPSIDFFNQSPRRPPLSGVRSHRRQRSSRSYRSFTSPARSRRYTSLNSGGVPRTTVQSFDATTYSEGSVDDGASDAPMPQPLRVLRRRPGGDLRAATNVGELDVTPLRRSRSVGSLTAYTDSLQSYSLQSPNRGSSNYVDIVTSDYSPERGGATFSLGAITEQVPHVPKQQLSLFSTHSSKPIMRPSFEAEAQKLAQIPDDIDDDGGIESALLKLEGRYERKSVKEEVEASPVSPSRVALSAISPKRDEMDDPVEQEKRDYRHQHMGDERDAEQLLAPDHAKEIVPHKSLLSARSRQNEDVKSFLSDGSRESYSSIPLLERGLTDEGRSKVVTQEWTNHSILQGPDEVDDATPFDQRSLQDSQHPSYDFIMKSSSMEKIHHGDTIPRDSTEHSFLNDGSDDDSDLSSEMSAELVERDEEDEDDGTFPPMTRGAQVSHLPAHPLGEPQPPPKAPPPSPPITLVQALAMSPETANIPEVHDHQVWQAKPLPPTPETTPTIPGYGISTGPPQDPTGTSEALRNAPKIVEPERLRKFSVHLPFILAFDSDVLAQQFTLIEKDALNELDWKELIDMRWKNANSDARSWVDFLRDSDARGVEVVIARFNIMVKWAISEVVLTQDVEERVRCLIKFIHIAIHCRRYRNFATMSQIAIALTSNEVARLTKTWALVPAGDIQTLQDLEALVSPTRNFYSLRAEMEGGGKASAETGCIPFVGIYTHDLLFNSQRPSEIASSPTTEPLVNFERCRTAASVVKTLLRLLEASTFYDFAPIEGIIERCLWMNALSDEDIRKHSEGLELAH